MVTVEPKKGDGHLSACEITLVQYDDLGIPKDVVRLGVRQGMWGTVKKLHNGLRAYQDARKSEAMVSRCAMMARITAKISSDVGTGTLGRVSGEEEKRETNDIQGQRGGGGIKWKYGKYSYAVDLKFSVSRTPRGLISSQFQMDKQLFYTESVFIVVSSVNFVFSIWIVMVSNLCIRSF
ncbi:PREDICTED: uncharacterized protein LOC109232346 isoform X1 [Nicotiana attenuata]|uniref:Uncharacterized protein n=1 Tax=Nicotiana attenuata TaxID=49451 RepID=A0A1J6I1A3_NICAT|nr:PREDICTED: uncharacterized protein LOC109232346 isoform X1 [Nicotiana attenuata]XP_019253623.1 PREDICTED: uncharacterized protein LOC109232346 isoform X1 [Nicotiana attenuata]OIS98861.1 hypothetical protein A4A49_02586 [Nicotiana attenuata]